MHQIHSKNPKNQKTRKNPEISPQNLPQTYYTHRKPPRNGIIPTPNTSKSRKIQQIHQSTRNCQKNPKIPKNHQNPQKQANYPKTPKNATNHPQSTKITTNLTSNRKITQNLYYTNPKHRKTSPNTKTHIKNPNKTTTTNAQIEKFPLKSAKQAKNSHKNTK